MRLVGQLRNIQEEHVSGTFFPELGIRRRQLSRSNTAGR